MFFWDQSLTSTINLTSLVKHLKIVGILQNFEICTKFSPLQLIAASIPTVIPKTDLGNKRFPRLI